MLSVLIRIYSYKSQRNTYTKKHPPGAGKMAKYKAAGTLLSLRWPQSVVSLPLLLHLHAYRPKAGLHQQDSGGESGLLFKHTVTWQPEARGAPSLKHCWSQL